MTDNDPNIWREVFGPLGQVIAFFGGAPRLNIAAAAAQSGNMVA